MENFVELKTFQGLSINEIKSITGSREISIWGVGHLGHLLKSSLERAGFTIKSFCDSNPQSQGKFFNKKEILPPSSVIEKCKNGTAFIIIASSRYKDEIENECLKRGLVKKVDFVNYISIPRPEAVVDIAGGCNIKCPSCPQGNMPDLRPSGVMKASVYKLVLNKLLKELPMLSQISLYFWGEPFMNPELAEIVKMTEKSVPCSIATNLQLGENLEAVVKAGPSQIMISVSGCGARYEKNHSGASWPVLLENMKKLKSYLEKYRAGTSVSVLYHVYKDNQGRDQERMREICRELEFRFVPAWSYLNPYEKYMDYCENRDIGPEAEEVLKMLPWDLDKAIGLARRDIGRPCLCQRIFPIINWDLSVALCHVYYSPLVVDNYLETPLDKILELRHKHPYCKECQRHGLHRLDIDVLLRSHPRDEIFKD